MHQVLKDTMLRLVKSIFYNYQPFNEWGGDEGLPSNRMMCYKWDSLSNVQNNQTVYGWEKFKYGRDNERNASLTIPE